MRPSACLLALEASPAPLALSCPPADLLSLSSAEIACVPYAALEAARCDTGDVDDADAVEPASRSRVPGAAVALALSPSEDQVAVVCAGSSLIALFALPDLRPLGQCDAGAPPAACAWTDDAHLLVRPAATACATLRGLGGEEVASSAMADVAAICVGWLSDAPDAALNLEAIKSWGAASSAADRSMCMQKSCRPPPAAAAAAAGDAEDPPPERAEGCGRRRRRQGRQGRQGRRRRGWLV